MTTMVEEEKKLEEIKPVEPKQEEEEKKEENKPVENPEESKDGQEESNGDEAAVVVAVAVAVAVAVDVDVATPPPEILLKVPMHCEACARKVRRCLQKIPGVENVITDCKSHQVIVKGEKADPVKVLERVQSKSKRPVELLSPIPSPPEEKKPSDEEEKAIPIEKPEIVTVILKVFMHCEKCAQEMKKRIQKMKGVETVEADLKNSEVCVKGAYDPAKLVKFMYKKFGKQAVIMKQLEPEPEKILEAEVEEGKEEEKKGEETEEKENEGEENINEKQEVVVAEAETQAKEGEVVVEETKVEGAEEEVKIIEYYHNNDPERNGVEMHAYLDYYKTYPPQMFSDENPNACIIM